MYTPRGFIDSESKDGVIKEGEWRSMKPDGEIAFQKLNPVCGSRYSNDALKVREALTTYVNSEEGTVLWQSQSDYIRRTSHYWTPARPEDGESYKFISVRPSVR